MVEAMGTQSSGRIEIPNGIATDIVFDDQDDIFGLQIHTSVAMQVTGHGFSAEATSRGGSGIRIERAGAGVVQSEFTEIDGVFYINTAPIPFYRKGQGQHKIHFLNASGGAGYVTVFTIKGWNR